ncbi:DUF3263 domain-containing protein [Nocardioides stalactiti]|uniref:DUF3263 domain-containing protein n=1 Tax=Nocardioides stalactiti TaxID=2755356 RepID=UPI00160358C6|nr:DUF3263 domain-containing protein [Nocardioides stalactiti]
METTPALTDLELAVLEFERARWKYSGAKDAAILSMFGWSPTRYYQFLNRLIDRPEALVADPQLVNRLQRLRDVRRRARAS